MKKSRLFWGTLFIVVAILLIVTQLGIINIQISMLDLLLTIFFGVSAIWSLFHKRITGFLFSIAFLAIIYDKPLGIEAITPWTVLLATTLLSIGCHILFQPRKTHKHDYELFEDIETINDEKIKAETYFGTTIKYINTSHLKSASIKNICGMMKVYFDHADIQEQEATLELNVSCAMLDLYVPKTWYIIDQTDGIFSSIDYKNKDGDTITHKIILKGKVNLSEVKIYDIDA